VIAPLEVTLDSTVAAGTVALDVRASDKTGALIVDFAGRHRLGPGEGEGDLTLHPVRFATEGGLQPATLFPITKRHLAATDGLVRATGTVNWSPEDVGGEIEIIIEDFATVAGEVGIEGVQGVILLDDVWPPSTPPEQVIAVGAVTAGLPLTNGAIIGRLENGLPVIRETQWKWAGGTVSSSPIRVTKEGDIEDFTLTLDNIDFGALLELTPEAENIEATGTLSGRIPMGFRDGAFQVVKGRLTTTGPGTLRYTPEALSEDFVETNPGLGLFLQAVENFAYEQIVIELDGKTGDEVDIALHIDGKNPDLYGGTPFELNVTITGRLDEIFRQSLDTMRIQELLRKQIREQEP